MFSRSALAFTSRALARRTISTSQLQFAEAGQAEVVLVGCGAPNRGMRKQRREQRYPALDSLE